MAEAKKLPLTPVDQEYTVAELVTLVPAAQYKGCLVYVSNGSAGSPCVARSDGTNWKVVAAIGATCAAS